MDSSISVQCSFFKDHLSRDFLSQFEFRHDGGQTNFYIWYLFDNFPLRKGQVGAFQLKVMLKMKVLTKMVL